MTIVELFLEYAVLIVFKLFNFAVLVALLWYAGKRYGVPALRSAYDAYCAYFDRLSRAHTDLAKKHQHILDEKEYDRQESDRLKERLMRWRATVDERNAIKQHEREKRIAKVKERIMRQQEVVARAHLYAQIMPDALKQARATLVDRAEAADMQEHMFEKVMTVLRKVK